MNENDMIDKLKLVAEEAVVDFSDVGVRSVLGSLNDLASDATNAVTVIEGLPSDSTVEQVKDQIRFELSKIKLSIDRINGEA